MRNREYLPLAARFACRQLTTPRLRATRRVVLVIGLRWRDRSDRTVWRPGITPESGLAARELKKHEYLKRQLTPRSTAYEALDNGFRSCAAPAVAQGLAGRAVERQDRGVRCTSGSPRLPHPFAARDRRA